MNEIQQRANLRAFLECIATCEGTTGPDGYRMLFGGGMFDAFDDHPRVRLPFRQNDGTRNYTSAAGRYQIIAPTWDRVRTRLALRDFSPPNQDAAAQELIAERGALSDVMHGRLQDALRKCATEWASLPDSRYSQPKRSVKFAMDAYSNAGGSLA